MTDTYSKTEIDAKMALNAERAGRASDGIASKMDRLLDAITAIGKDVADFKADSKASITALAADVKTDYQNTRSTINNFALGSLAIVITVVLGVVVLVWAAQGNMTTANGNVLSAFGSGKEAAEAVAEARAAAAPQPKFDDQTGKRLPQ